MGSAGERVWVDITVRERSPGRDESPNTHSPAWTGQSQRVRRHTWESSMGLVVSVVKEVDGWYISSWRRPDRRAACDEEARRIVA